MLSVRKSYKNYAELGIIKWFCIITVLYNGDIQIKHLN